MRAEAKASARTNFIFHIPLAEQVRRRFAKPQRLVQFQHGIRILSGIGVDRHTSVFQTEIEGALPSCPSILRDANTGADQDHHPDSESGRRFNSTFVSLSSGLQTLIVKSRLLTGENSVQIRGDPPFPHPW